MSDLIARAFEWYFTRVLRCEPLPSLRRSR